MFARTGIGLRLSCSWLFVGVIAAIAVFVAASCSTQSRVSNEAPVTVAAERSPAPAAVDMRPRIVAFGDSLTAGYGLPPSDSYPAQLQKLLDDQGYQYEVVNAGVSGETTAGGLRRIDSALDGDVRVVIVGLGGNDALRGLPPTELKKNLDGIVGKARSGGAKVLLAGMEAPPMMGPEYTTAFRNVYRDVAAEQHVAEIPFLLAGVAGIDDLNQADGIHPNAKGAAIVARNVYEHLSPMLAR